MSWTDDLKRRKDEQPNHADKAKNQYNDLSASMSSMVTSVLVELGKALWGRGLFGYKYHFMDREDLRGYRFWEISPHRISYIYRDTLSVRLSLDMKHFGISGFEQCECETPKSIGQESRDMSEQALKETLLNVCEQLKWYQKD